MRRTAAFMFVLFALAVPAGRAQAQSSGVNFISVGIGGADSSLPQIELPVRVTGIVSVDFSGTEAAGCAAVGRCGLSGTDAFDPGRSGQMVIERLRIGRKRKLVGLLALGADRPVTTTSHTRRGSDGVCADVATQQFFTDVLGGQLSNSISVRLGNSELPAFDENLFETRCPGPLDSDLLPLLPSRRLPRAVIEKGGSLNLSTTRPFSKGGFSGTLRSTLVLHFDKPRTVSQGNEPGVSRRIVRHRFRETEVAYRIERVSGTAGFSFSGVGDPGRCLQLDACGATGTTTESPAATGGDFELDSVTSARVPRRDVRTLLGLASGGRTHHLYASGAGRWRSHTGTLDGSVSWGTRGACTDSVPLRSGTIAGTAAGSRFRLSYDDPELGGGALQTRCGGPLRSDLAGARPLASGSVPLSALRRKTVTVQLTKAPGVVPTGAYSGSIHAGITVTLRRIEVSEQVYSVRF